MAAISQTLRRARRAVRLYQDVHEQTGSSIVALRTVARMVTRTIPRDIQKARSAGRYPAEVERIEAIKAERGNRRAFLGVKFTGGLGDALVVARFLRDLSAYAGGFDFDVYSTQPDRANWVFGAVDGFRGSHGDDLFDLTLSSYDIAARVSQFVVFHEAGLQGPRLRSQPKLMQAVNHAMRFRAKIAPFIENHPYMDGYLGQRAVFANRSRADFLHSMVDVPYGGDRLELPAVAGMAARHGLTPGRYITVHNGFDPEFFTYTGQATKCYPHFGAVVAILRQKRPDLRLVQIGVATSQPLANVDVNLVNRTSVREAAGLLSEALMHIDNEGGLVHLARCLGVDSAVVFGPTPSNYLGYAGNVNIDPVFCGGCWWSNETWMARCPRGFATARCMTEQDPAVVAGAVERHLKASGRGSAVGDGAVKVLDP